MDDILSWLVDENDRLARAEADRRDKLLADVHRGFDEAKTNITLLLRRKIVCSSEDESISNPPVADRRPPKRKSPLELELEPEPSRKSPPEQLAKSKFRSAICLLPFGCYTLFLIPCTPCLCID